MLLKMLFASFFILTADVAPASSAAKYNGVADTLYINPSQPYQVRFELHGHDDRIFAAVPKTMHLRDNGAGGPYMDCSTQAEKCYDGVVHLVVDKEDLLSDSTYRYLSYIFSPSCIYKLPDRCGLAIIKYKEITKDGIGESGVFLFESGFGVKWFAYTNPDSGALSASFSYVRGRPLLDDRITPK